MARSEAQPRRRKVLKVIDGAVFGVILLWLVFVSETLLQLIMTDGGLSDLSEEEKQTFQNITKLFLAFSGYLLVFHFREMIALLLKNGLYVAILVFAVMSYAWSIDPGITLRRCMMLVSFSMIACFIVVRYDLRSIIRLFLYLSLISVSLSLYFIIFDPFLGMNLDGRGARGAFTHKNVFSEFLLVTFIPVLMAIRLRLLKPSIGYPYLALYFVLLAIGNSATTWLIVAFMVGLYLLAAPTRIPRKLFAVFVAFSAAIGILATLLAIIFLDEIFAALNRDPTLTGRDAVWAYSFSMILERLPGGYGYAAFWESEPILSYVQNTLNWRITHAHNGYIQVCVELGLIGVGLLVVYFVQCLARLVLSKPSADLRAFLLPTLIGLLVYNLAETQLLIAKNIGWIVILICLFLTTRGLNQIRERHASPLRA